VVLKNVGVICPACDGPGLHWNCDVERDKRDDTIPEKRKRKMCMCYYTTHSYLSKEQLTPPTQKVIAVPLPIAGGVTATNKIEADLRTKAATSV
jgi:hypothetical protein